MSVRAGLPGGPSSSQAQAPSGAFESVQRLELPAPVVERSLAGARRLGELYWRELERSSLGLIRARPAAGAPQLRVLGVGPALLHFGRPHLSVTPRSVTCSYPIRGGLLTRHPGGSISFSQTESDGVEISSAINGFFPRLAGRPGRSRWHGLLYPHVQARLHELLGRRYFSRLWQEARR